MATNARESRQSVQFFDVDLFRNKLEHFMRRQSSEMCEMTNTKKRKLSDRWSDSEKEDLELAEDYREDLIYRFGKRQCPNASYYPLEEEDLELEEVSPLALPSPVTVPARESNQPWPFFEYNSMDAIVASAGGAATQHHEDEVEDSLATRRKLSGYSEVSYPSTMESDDWMSACPPFSRGSLSHCSSYTSSQSNSHPQTPTYNSTLDADSLTADGKDVDLDISAMAPHERSLLAALAPEKFEKAALIKKAFKQSDRLLGKLVREHQPTVGEEGVREDVGMEMDDGEYDQVFGELMQV